MSRKSQLRTTGLTDDPEYKKRNKIQFQLFYNYGRIIVSCSAADISPAVVQLEVNYVENNNS